MLDYYSELPAPNKKKTIQNLYNKIKNMEKYRNINPEIILEISKIFMEKYPIEKMGSLIGWQIFAFKECQNEIIILIDNKIEKSVNKIKDFILKKHNYNKSVHFD